MWPNGWGSCESLQGGSGGEGGGKGSQHARSMASRDEIAHLHGLRGWDEVLLSGLVGQGEQIRARSSMRCLPPSARVSKGHRMESRVLANP